MSNFFPTVLTIVMHTPLWVWPLYALLLFVGFQRSRDGAVPIWRLMILPVIVAGLAILNIVTGGLGVLPAALFGLLVGGLVGWRLEPKGATRHLADGRVWQRGEWWTLGQIAVILVFRYGASVAPVFNPVLRTDAIWLSGTMFISATLSALFLGRTATKLRVYFGDSPVAA